MPESSWNELRTSVCSCQIKPKRCKLRFYCRLAAWLGETTVGKDAADKDSMLEPGLGDATKTTPRSCKRHRCLVFAKKTHTRATTWKHSLNFNQRIASSFETCLAADSQASPQVLSGCCQDRKSDPALCCLVDITLFVCAPGWALGRVQGLDRWVW